MLCELLVWHIGILVGMANRACVTLFWAVKKHADWVAFDNRILYLSDMEVESQGQVPTR